MADYWKSQPRKFCQYCKCWIADNKPSIEFHERGKNHKQNVAAKIDEIKKKSVEKAKKEEKMSKEFAAMEEAALKAYQEDMKRLQAESGASEAPVQTRKRAEKAERAEKAVETSSNSESDAWIQGTTDDGLIYYYNTQTGESQWNKPEGFQGESVSSDQTGQTSGGSAWMEAVSPDGYTYYYNTETGESNWEKPADYSPQEGSPAEEDTEQEILSTPQPEPLTSEDSSEASKEAAEPAESKQSRVPKISFRKRKEESAPLEEKADNEAKADEEAKKEEKDGGDGDGIEPAVPAKQEEIPAKKPRKTNPYGEWEQIQEEEDPYENVDLQLPQIESGVAASTPASDLPSEPKTKFKERAITSLGEDSSAGATFKKRKTENGKSRSLRQRGKDD